MWFFKSKQARLKKAAIEYTRAVIIEYDEKIKASINDLKQSDSEIDGIRKNSKTLNVYLEAIVKICQRSVEHVEIRDKISQLYTDSQKLKF